MLKAQSQIEEENLSLILGLMLTRQEITKKLNYFNELVKFIIKNDINALYYFSSKNFQLKELDVLLYKEKYKFSYGNEKISITVKLLYPILNPSECELYKHKELQVDNITKEIQNTFRDKDTIDEKNEKYNEFFKQRATDRLINLLPGKKGIEYENWATFEYEDWAINCVNLLGDQIVEKIINEEEDKERQMRGGFKEGRLYLSVVLKLNELIQNKNKKEGE